MPEHKERKSRRDFLQLGETLPAWFQSRGRRGSSVSKIEAAQDQNNRDPTPKRARRWQISLRTIFIFTAICALFMAVFGEFMMAHPWLFLAIAVFTLAVEVLPWLLLESAIYLFFKVVFRDDDKPGR